MCVCNMCVVFFYYYYYNVICVNFNVCEYVHVWYKYNITLYNLIIRNYRGLVTLVYIVIML